MKASSKKKLSVVLSVGIGAALLAFIIWKKGTSFHEILEAMGRFSFACVASIIACSCAQVLCMILRIWVLFPRAKRVPLFRVARAISWGQFLNTFFPARAGDVVKAVLVSGGTSEVSVFTSAGVIIADKLVDIIALVGLILFTRAYLMPGIQWPAGLPPWTLAILPAAALVIFIFWRWLFRKHQENIRKWIQHFNSGILVLKHPRHLIPALVLGVSGWLCEVVALKVLCEFQGLPLDLDKAVFVLLVLNLAIAVPVSLANVGTFEASLVFALGFFGMSVSDAIAVATMHHAAQLCGITLWALAMGIGQRLCRSKHDPPSVPMKLDAAHE